MIALRGWVLSLSVIVVVAVGCEVAIGAEAVKRDAHWPQWRGPNGDGVARDADPPLQWGDDKNIKWKTAIPGGGKSTPVVWGNHIYVTSAIVTGTPGPGGGGRFGSKPPAMTQFVLFALNRHNGKIAWKKIARETVPHETTHRDGSWAAGSVVTDGQVIIANFGSAGIFGFDMKGETLWATDLGDMRTRNGFGEGASPALHGKYLVINWDHEGDSFIVALNKTNGEEIWRNDRDERTSWSTPVVTNVNGKDQVIVSATNNTYGYDLATGKVIWQCSGMTTNAIPTPIVVDGVVYLASGYRGNALQAIKLSQAKGKVQAGGALLWSYGRDTPYVPTPVVYGDGLYMIKSNTGILTRVSIKTGKVDFGPERLEGIRGVYASAVAAADRIYIVGRFGTTVVVKHDKTFKVLATNKLDDAFDASPAIVGKHLFLRGEKHLYCIAGSER